MTQIILKDEEELIKSLTNKKKSKLSSKEMWAYMRENHLKNIPTKTEDIQKEILITLIKILYEIKIHI